MSFKFFAGGLNSDNNLNTNPVGQSAQSMSSKFSDNSFNPHSASSVKFRFVRKRMVRVTGEKSASSVKSRLMRAKGAALLSVLAFSALIAVVLPLILSDTQLEYATAHHKLNHLKAEYNARSAAELSLLRILIYKGAEKQLKKQHNNLPSSAQKIASSVSHSLLDMIWQSPVLWPISLSEDFLESEKKEVAKIMEESFVKGSYSSQIEPEDGKMDINDLSSPVPFLREFTWDTLYSLLLSAGEEDEFDSDLQQEARELLNNLADWTDPDFTSRNGGSEESSMGVLPPNRSFALMEEVETAPGMTPALFKILKPHITVYGGKGLNINYTGPALLKALGLPEELALEVLNRTQITGESYQPFQDKGEFCEWMESLRWSLCPILEERYRTTDMLQFNTPLHFRIHAVGNFRNALSRVESLTYDANQTALSYQNALKTERKLRQENPESAEGPQVRPTESAAKKKANPLPYQTSPPLLIMYWKESL